MFLIISGGWGFYIGRLNIYQADFASGLILMLSVLFLSLLFYELKWGKRKTPQLFDHQNLNEQQFNLGWESSTVVNGLGKSVYSRMAFGAVGLFLLLVVLLANHRLISALDPFAT